jgi:hypothetical protein
VKVSEDLPDYGAELWRGATMLRVRLKEMESFGALLLLLTSEASAFPWRKPPLASGATQKAIDAATGQEDITIPAGYTWSVLSYWWAFDQPIKGLEYVDGQLYTMLFEKSSVSHYEHDLLPEYYVFDPLGLTSHTHGYACKNLGSLDVEGFFNAPFIMVEVGTERVEEKTVRCSFCGTESVVDRRATRVRCPSCDQVSFYWPRLFGTRERALVEVVEP